MCDLSNESDGERCPKDLEFLRKRKAQNLRKWREEKKKTPQQRVIVVNEGAAPSISSEKVLAETEDFVTDWREEEYESEEENNEADDASLSEDSESEGLAEDEKLFCGSQITRAEFLVALNVLKFSHKLNNETMKAIMQLFSMLLPKPNNCPTSLGALSSLKCLKQNSHSTCSCCLKCESILESDFCTRCKQKTSSRFAIFDILPQLDIVLSNKTFVKQLTTNSAQRRSQVLSTAQDGLIYGSRERGPLTISLNLNSDGAPITNSGSSMWPVMGTILELNQSSREKFTNLLIFGLWIDKTRPPYAIFFAKVLEKLMQLNETTINIKGFDVFIRCQALIADLPAKAALLNIKQFNGHYGCPACKHEGKSYHGNYIYPFNSEHLELKTHEDYLTYGAEAEARKEAVFGFKGRTCFANILRLPDQIPFDPMHLIFQGHAKWLFEQFITNTELDDIFLGSAKNKSPKLQAIQAGLSLVKLPSIINRKPKDFEFVSKWKSSEIKTFLFYLAVPLFVDVMPSFYFYEFAGYVIAIRILYEPGISDQDLESAQQLLEAYVSNIENNFSYKAYRFTLHAHLHLPRQVRQLGPLESHTQFVFEGALGQLKKLMHGTRGHLDQAARNFTTMKQFCSYLANHIDTIHPDVANLIKDHFEFYSCSRTSYLIGHQRIRSLSKLEIKLLGRYFSKDKTSVITSTKAKINGLIFNSLINNKEVNDYTIRYEHERSMHFGFIRYFFKYLDRIFAFVERISVETDALMALNSLPASSGRFYDLLKGGLFHKYFKLVRKESNVQYEVVVGDLIRGRCLVVKTKSSSFLTNINTKFEHD